MGIVAFFIVVGPRVLYPSNIAWLEQGDPATHYLGWHFFRNSEWSFPVGKNPEFGLELSSSVVFSDSVPLFAILFKPFSNLLPETFQYFGIWILACFMLQAWFGWKLAGLVTTSNTVRLLSAGIFVFSPPMLGRLFGHYSLVGHFLILAGLYLSLRPSQEHRTIYWMLVLAAAALVHAYLAALVTVLWLSDLLQLIIRNRRLNGQHVFEFLGTLSLLIFVCWQAGYFLFSSGVSTPGLYGIYKMDLLSVVDAGGWSYVLRDIPQSEGEYEGFNFLGTGVILLMIFVLPALLQGQVSVLKQIKQRPVLTLALTGLTVYALSHKLGIGPLQFELPLPQWLTPLTSTFRASGRMFWPVFYVIIFVVIFVIVRSNDRRVASYLLAFALIVQIVDTSAAWRGTREKLMSEPAAEWTTVLDGPFWSKTATQYSKVRWVLPQNHPPDWRTIAMYAGAHGMSTDAVYLARLDHVALGAARQTVVKSLNTGQYKPDSLYVFEGDNGVFQQRVIMNLDASTDLLTKLDGFTVIAPGWKQCDSCLSLADELTRADVLVPVKIGERILFSDAGTGPRFLGQGWSQHGPSGVWSVASVADLILPVSGDTPKSVFIEAIALVSTSHPEQNIELYVNDVFSMSVTLIEYSGNLIDIPIPERVREALKDQGQIRIEFRFADAARPVDVGLGADTRTLALHLGALTLR
jgi:hypothetical protein